MHVLDSVFFAGTVACAVVMNKHKNPRFGLGIKSEEKNAEIWDFYVGNIVANNRPFGLGIVF